MLRLEWRGNAWRLMAGYGALRLGTAGGARLGRERNGNAGRRMDRLARFGGSGSSVDRLGGDGLAWNAGVSFRMACLAEASKGRIGWVSCVGARHGNQHDRRNNERIQMENRVAHPGVG